MIKPLDRDRQMMVEVILPDLERIARIICPRDDDALGVASLAAVKAAAIWESRSDISYRKFAVQCARFALIRHRKRRYAQIKELSDRLNPPDHRASIDVQSLIDALPLLDRKIFVLRFVKGCSVMTISKWTKVKKNKVYASLAQSVDKMREAIGDG